jgi:hypothetical protein
MLKDYQGTNSSHIFKLTEPLQMIIVTSDRGGDKPEIKPFEPDPGNAGGGSR